MIKFLVAHRVTIPKKCQLFSEVITCSLSIKNCLNYDYIILFYIFAKELQIQEINGTRNSSEQLLLN